MQDARLQLKTFVFQVEQMRMAQVRLQGLKEGQSSESENAINHILEMKRQLELVVDDSIKEFNTSNQVRIAPEQVEADSTLQASLEDNLKRWETDLEQVQKELIDQALIDAKQGSKSARYMALEKNEATLFAKVQKTKIKLVMVQERVASPVFNKTVNEIVNSAKA